MSEPGSRQGLKMSSMKTYEHEAKDETSPVQQILVISLRLQDKVVDLGVFRVHQC